MLNSHDISNNDKPYKANMLCLHKEKKTIITTLKPFITVLYVH